MQLINKGCSARRSASSNKNFFLKIVPHVFIKEELVAEVVALGRLPIQQKGGMTKVLSYLLFVGETYIESSS